MNLHINVLFCLKDGGAVSKGKTIGEAHIGRTGSAEVSEHCYRFLNPDVKMNLTRLGKGELVMSHAVYRQPVKIAFPKPAYKQETVT